MTDIREIFLSFNLPQNIENNNTKSKKFFLQAMSVISDAFLEKKSVNIEMFYDKLSLAIEGRILTYEQHLKYKDDKLYVEIAHSGLNNELVKKIRNKFAKDNILYINNILAVFLNNIIKIVFEIIYILHDDDNQKPTNENIDTEANDLAQMIIKEYKNNKAGYKSINIKYYEYKYITIAYTLYLITAFGIIFMFEEMTYGKITNYIDSKLFKEHSKKLLELAVNNKENISKYSYTKNAISFALIITNSITGVIAYLLSISADKKEKEILVPLHDTEGLNDSTILKKLDELIVRMLSQNLKDAKTNSDDGSNNEFVQKYCDKINDKLRLKENATDLWLETYQSYVKKQLYKEVMNDLKEESVGYDDAVCKYEEFSFINKLNSKKDSLKFALLQI